MSFSLQAFVAKYNGCWWRQKNGIPTGGSLCVQLANITVFYVMAKKVYNVPSMMLNAADIKRFIDDGMGFFFGTEEEFIRWLEKVNQEIRPYGLQIDESSFKENGTEEEIAERAGMNEVETSFEIKPTPKKPYTWGVRIDHTC